MLMFSDLGSLLGDLGNVLGFIVLGLTVLDRPSSDLELWRASASFL